MCLFFSSRVFLMIFLRLGEIGWLLLFFCLLSNSLSFVPSTLVPPSPTPHPLPPSVQTLLPPPAPACCCQPLVGSDKGDPSLTRAEGACTVPAVATDDRGRAWFLRQTVASERDCGPVWLKLRLPLLHKPPPPPSASPPQWAGSRSLDPALHVNG